MNTNLVVISGRITRDIEVKQSPISNNKYCRNSIAVDLGKDQKGNKKTAFVLFTLWENNAIYLEKYAEKGSRIILQGYLDQNKTFNNEKNCNEYELVFKPRQVEIIDWKKKETSALTGELPNQDVNPSNSEDPFETFANMNFNTDVQSQFDITDDDLPF